MCVLLPSISATPIVQTSYKGWEPIDSEIGSLAQSICRVADSEVKIAFIITHKEIM